MNANISSILVQHLQNNQLFPLDDNFNKNVTSISLFLNASLHQQGTDTPQQHDFSLSFSTQILLIVIYTFTTLMSVVGNALVIVVFLVGRRSRTDLRWFLVNLAGADLVMALFCMPFTFTSTMLGTWIFSFPMCPVVLFMQSLSVTASVCTITAIGIDRFWVVYYPLKSRITKSRSRLVITCIWLLSLLLSSVQIFVGRVKVVNTDDKLFESVECTEIWPEPEDLYCRLYTIYLFLVTYLLPLLILTYTYGMVSRKLWTRTAPGNADRSRDFQQLQSKKKVIKMLVLVVTFFGVCWLPLHLFFFVLNFYRDMDVVWTPPEKMVYIAFYCCAHWLAMSNSFVNPIIYGFFNESFRVSPSFISVHIFSHSSNFSN
ncbi:hypothetical protein HELRODRAFT_111311 [Helobdella robusta]|uniref:G-protein coupled receptors family 1 profile domain-containing protein n=1 Tax=Helobdella robusta TaxID=6412 RepID=T1EFA2_HELRO|nr:hypothetical protein HELRODRAFT_111311 [Helobdella robusta]ESO05422.1 hypothetical protein HELRODRAFT_111311 [Helobdella robusta]